MLETLSLLSYWIKSWITVLIIYITTNLKVLPFAWHVRLFYGYFRHYYFHHRSIPASTASLSTATLFQPTIYASYAPLGELDYSIHKSNSTYLTDLDIARGHHLYCLFREGVNKYSKDRKNGMFIPALGGVSLSFKREIKPYQKYEIWTRVLSWDEKWVYMVSNFVQAGKVKPKGFTDQPWRGREVQKFQSSKSDKPPVLYATAISKYVFKQGRRTIPPTKFLQDCNLLPLDRAEDLDGGFRGGDHKEKVGPSVSTKIEERRARGMALANHVAGLEDAHACFTGEDDVIFARY